MTLSLPSDDQVALSRGVADFLDTSFPLERFRSGADNDVDRWDALVGLGIIGIAVDEAHGGLGLTVVEEAMVCRELGRTLVSPALLGAMLAPHIALRGGDEALAAAIIGGERRVGISAGKAGGEYRIVDAPDGLFVHIDGDAVSLIKAGPDALRALDCIDDTISLAAAGAGANVLAEATAPDLALAAHVMAAGMLCGLLETIRDMAAEYARTRVQFGRPIGAFQAIKHRCADAALGAEISWTQTWHAANALQSGAPDAEFHARTAKWLAGDEALSAARFDIQVHGGMGFTQEADAQLMMKRTHVLHQMFGNPRLVPARLAELELEA